MNHIFKTLVQSTAIATGLLTVGVAAAEGSANIGAATFNTQGELVLPEGFREWVFIGAPLTPHGLNNGKAGFPEYHHVYVNPDAFAVYQRTCEFPDGTVIAKELVCHPICVSLYRPTRSGLSATLRGSWCLPLKHCHLCPESVASLLLPRPSSARGSLYSSS